MASFLALPAEIYDRIQLELGFFPDLFRLRMTCKFFHDRIDPMQAGNLDMADVFSDYAVEKGLWGCYECVRMRPAWKFADAMRKG